jgi:hypothetical protein
MKLALACLVLVLPGCVWYLHPTCTDGVKDGNETDVDCGGSCGKCNIGQRCGQNTDCDDSICVAGECTPDQCDDGKVDGQETDVDCGGGMCRKCAGGRNCSVASDCFSGTCVAGVNTCSELATVSFADEIAYPSGVKTYALFTGDMNGDGLPDVVAANEEASSISVFLDDSTGTLQCAACEDTAFATGEYPTGGALADFNHDGVLDVVTADYHGNSVTVLLGIKSMTTGSGTGQLAPKTSYPTVPGAETSNLAVGDINSDGNLDVIATNPQSGSISVFLGKGDGTLAPAVDIPVGVQEMSMPYSAAIGDFNGDGKLDVAIADLVTGPVIVKLGNGDGTFGDDVIYPTGATGPFIIITTDVDLDGHLDLVCSNRGSDNVTVFRGRGDGTFKKPILASTGMGTGPYSIAVADFNLDGVPDLVTANFMSSTGTILLGTGSGYFDMPIDAGACGHNSYGTVAADFNGDGEPDFATGNAVSWDVTVRLSTSH